MPRHPGMLCSRCGTSTWWLTVPGAWKTRTWNQTDSPQPWRWILLGSHQTVHQQPHACTWSYICFLLPSTADGGFCWWVFWPESHQSGMLYSCAHFVVNCAETSGGRCFHIKINTIDTVMFSSSMNGTLLKHLSWNARNSRDNENKVS